MDVLEANLDLMGRLYFLIATGDKDVMNKNEAKQLMLGFSKRLSKVSLKDLV